jgi:hypothetical protein
MKEKDGGGGTQEGGAAAALRIHVGGAAGSSQPLRAWKGRPGCILRVRAQVPREIV